MNYILHLNKAFEKFCVDDRLTPFHISLYYSLFQFWNTARFRNPISISRDELMTSSKIGSVNTYIRCIKELDKWKYIQYIPSYNPQKGSQVHMYNFNNSSNNANNISNNKGSNKGNEKANANADETQVIPSINNSNNLNNTNSINGDSHSQISNLIHSSNDTTKNDFSNHEGQKEKSCAKKEKKESIQTESRFPRPLLEEIKNYFSKNNCQALEAEKFYNHYESNGWLVGGKTPMKNWKASANNWMLNTVKFNKTNSLSAITNKNYNEPL